MRKEVLARMVADPGFDPTEWLGEAISNYIQAHGSKLIANPFVRKYMFEGMEEGDIQAIAAEIAAYTASSNTNEVWHDFAPRLDQFTSTNNWRATEAVKSLINSPAFGPDPNLADPIIRLRGTRVPPRMIVRHLTQDQVGILIRNWSINWEWDEWEQVLPRLKPDDLLPALLKNEFVFQDNDHFNLNKVIQHRPPNGTVSPTGWVTEIQHVLVQFIKHAPAHHMYQLLEWINEINLLNLYAAEKNTSLAGKERVEKKESIRVNEMLCRCGSSCTTTPGITLHFKKCSKRNKIRVVCAALAKLQRSFLPIRGAFGAVRVCADCGQPSKSNSQHNEHRAKHCPGRLEIE